MNVGSVPRARAWLVASFVVATACAGRESVMAKTNHGVALSTQEHSPGHWKAIALPDTRIIRQYVPSSPSNHVVIWTYGHKSTTIHFTDPLITKDPTCDDKEGMCSWDVPPSLLKEGENNHKYKYTITGKHDDKTDLDPNDPWIEVDR